jgi:hypothetical protein
MTSNQKDDELKREIEQIVGRESYIEMNREIVISDNGIDKLLALVNREKGKALRDGLRMVLRLEEKISRIESSLTHVSSGKVETEILEELGKVQELIEKYELKPSVKMEGE